MRHSSRILLKQLSEAFVEHSSCSYLWFGRSKIQSGLEFSLRQTLVCEGSAVNLAEAQDDRVHGGGGQDPSPTKEKKKRARGRRSCMLRFNIRAKNCVVLLKRVRFMQASRVAVRLNKAEEAHAMLVQEFASGTFRKETVRDPGFIPATTSKLFARQIEKWASDERCDRCGQLRVGVCPCRLPKVPVRGHYDPSSLSYIPHFDKDTYLDFVTACRISETRCHMCDAIIVGLDCPCRRDYHDEIR
jgi:hypothetical protein